MIISKVKDLGEFYSVNNSITVPKDSGNRDYRKIQAWLKNKDNKLEDSKAEAVKKKKS